MSILVSWCVLVYLFDDYHCHYVLMTHLWIDTTKKDTHRQKVGASVFLYASMYMHLNLLYEHLVLFPWTQICVYLQSNVTNAD